MNERGGGSNSFQKNDKVILSKGAKLYKINHHKDGALWRIKDSSTGNAENLQITKDLNATVIKAVSNDVYRITSECKNKKAKTQTFTADVSSSEVKKSVQKKKQDTTKKSKDMLNNLINDVKSVMQNQVKNTATQLKEAAVWLDQNLKDASSHVDPVTVLVPDTTKAMSTTYGSIDEIQQRLDSIYVSAPQVIQNRIKKHKETIRLAEEYIDKHYDRERNR